MKVRPVKKEKEPQRIEINTDHIKLDSFLKLSGAVLSGGEAKLAVQNGAVFVNGEACLMRGKKLFPGDRVSYEGAVFLIAGAEE